jgi:hypothetical protein
MSVRTPSKFNIRRVILNVGVEPNNSFTYFLIYFLESSKDCVTLDIRYEELKAEKQNMFGMIKNI